MMTSFENLAYTTAITPEGVQIGVCRLNEHGYWPANIPPFNSWHEAREYVAYLNDRIFGKNELEALKISATTLNKV